MVLTLQFCAFSGIIDTIIRWFSAGRVAHVDAVMPDGRLLGAQHDADMGNHPSGVWVRPENYGERWGINNRIQIKIRASQEQEQLFYAFLRHQIGKPYDTTAIWAFVFARDWRKEESWFCSELIMAALEHAGILTKSAPMNKITPQELLLICSEKGSMLYLDEIK